MQSELNGETQVFFIIGDPIAQVKSPGLLTARFAERGVNAVCVPGHVERNGMSAFMAGLNALKNAPGLVITVPHKQASLGYCDQLTTRAQFAQSVNVMRYSEDGWIGDNTDGRPRLRTSLKARGSNRLTEVPFIIKVPSIGRRAAKYKQDNVIFRNQVGANKPFMHHQRTGSAVVYASKW